MKLNFRHVKLEFQASGCDTWFQKKQKAVCTLNTVPRYLSNAHSSEACLSGEQQPPLPLHAAEREVHMVQLKEKCIGFKLQGQADFQSSLPLYQARAFRC